MSHVGAKNPTNRCFPFWKDYVTCVNDEKTSNPSVCLAFREDYVECLHHHKEFSRRARIEKTYADQQKSKAAAHH